MAQTDVPPPALDPPVGGARAERLRETAVLVGCLLGLRVVVSPLLALSVGMTLDPVGAVLGAVVVAVASWSMLIWIAGVAAVQFGLADRPRRLRWGLIVAAAPVAALLATFVERVPLVIADPRMLLVGNPFTVIEMVVFTGSVALAMLVASSLLACRARALAATGAVLTALGAALALLLVVQSFEVYFHLGSDPVIVSNAEGDRYVLTVTATLGVVITGVVLAAMSRRRALIITSIVVALVAILIALVFPVPSGRFDPVEPADPDLHYAPCYGEGDPNCVGG